MSTRVTGPRECRRRRSARLLASLCLAVAIEAPAMVPQPVVWPQDAGTAGWPRHPARAPDGFLLTVPGRSFALPSDHASHPDVRTEWWYFTGPLRGPGGELFAFQATWFRRALLHAVAEGRSPLATRDVVLFHGVLADVATGERFVADVGSRAFPTWAHAADERLSLAVFGHRLDDVAGEGRAAALAVAPGGADVRLRLDLAASPVLLHGEEPGLSLKGSEPGQASWYASLPRIPASGTVQLPGAVPLAVEGTLWFDHEFGSMGMAAGIEGWDWFSVALDDGSALVLYLLRRDDGGIDGASSGTWSRSDGHVEHLARDELSVIVRRHWTSPTSGARYPASWRIEVAGAGLVLDVEPVLADQEVATPATTGVTYWEGLCRFRGAHRGRSVTGEGFVELVGYAEAITGRFEPRD